MAFCIVYITHENKESATKLAHAIVQEKLAACANLFPIKSMYWWDQVIQSEDEYVSILKTTREGWPALKQRVEELHPYDVPCIMKIEVEANEAYEEWISKQVL